MLRFNSVTERDFIGKTLWLVSASWRGGHDKRNIRLMNIHDNQKDAEADHARLTAEAYNYVGFVQHSIRQFREVETNANG